MLTIADASDVAPFPTWVWVALATIPLTLLAAAIITALATPAAHAPVAPVVTNTCGQRGGHYYQKRDGNWTCAECGDVVVVERAPYDQEATA